VNVPKLYPSFALEQVPSTQYPQAPSVTSPEMVVLETVALMLAFRK
jgi:hypothetical protein